MKTLLFAASLIAACTLNAADFRNATWGMSPEQVIKSEKIKLKKIFKNKTDLSGKIYLLNNEFYLTYFSNIRNSIRVPIIQRLKI